RPPAGARDHDRIALGEPAARERAGHAAEVEVRTIDPLHRKSERRGTAVVLDLDALEIFQEMRALKPGREGTARRDVVAEAGRERNREQRAEAERLGELAIGDHDVPECLLV